MSTAAAKFGQRTYRSGGYHNPATVGANFARTTIWTGAVYTVCGWARPEDTSAATFKAIFAHINSGTLLKWIGFNGADLELRGGGGGTSFGFTYSSTGSLTASPFFWAVTNDGTTGANSFIGYARRHEQKSLTTTSRAGTATSGTEFRFSNDPTPSIFFGRMADIRMWDAVLTPREIMIESLRHSPVRQRNLRGWYPLQGASAAERTRDYSGYTNGTPVNLTETSMTTIWAPRNIARTRTHSPRLMRGFPPQFVPIWALSNSLRSRQHV